METVRDRLDDFDATTAGRAIQTFVDELSNWYVRRSRRRFWDGDPAAFATLHECLVSVAQLLAPFYPFIADELYDNLDGGEPSVHLCDFPVAGPRDVELEQAMDVARQTVRLGLAARAQAKLKVRQPLRAAVSWPPGASAPPSSSWRRSSATSSTCTSCASSPRPTSWARSNSSPTTGRWDPASASRCRWWPPPWRGWIRRTWPRRCARGHRRRSTSGATSTRWAPMTCSSR